MHALRLVHPARAGVRWFTPHRAPSPRIFPSPSTTALRSPILRLQAPPAARPQRLFSHTARHPSSWPDPRRHDPEEQLRRARPLITADGLSKLLWSPGLHLVITVSVVAAGVFYYSNLQTVPVSGRRRFNCYSEAKVRATSEAQAKRIEWELERAGGRFLDDWDWRTRLVKKVMSRLIPVSGMEDSAWEIKVIDDPSKVNAFVLPGGKVFVFSGLIPIARNEHGMAAVLGHEIAHNLAEHVAEQMSSQLGVNILLYSLISLTGGVGLLITTWLGNVMLDLVFSRPMGRRQEAEADYIGLMMMAEACYDPREALGFWERMKKMQEEEPPEWISTHPSHSNRIQKIQEWLPKALDKMYESDCQGTAVFASLFRRALEGHSFMEERDDI